MYQKNRPTEKYAHKSYDMHVNYTELQKYRKVCPLMLFSRLWTYIAVIIYQKSEIDDVEPLRASFAFYPLNFMHAVLTIFAGWRFGTATVTCVAQVQSDVQLNDGRRTHGFSILHDQWPQHSRQLHASFVVAMWHVIAATCCQAQTGQPQKLLNQPGLYCTANDEDTQLSVQHDSARLNHSRVRRASG